MNHSLYYFFVALAFKLNFFKIELNAGNCCHKYSPRVLVSSQERCRAEMGDRIKPTPRLTREEFKFDKTDTFANTVKNYVMYKHKEETGTISFIRQCLIFIPFINWCYFSFLIKVGRRFSIHLLRIMFVK